MARISRCSGSNATMLALVTATKNSMRTIRDALESAASFRQKVKHYLIDAASSDGTREYLASFVTTTGNSVLLSQTGTGLYPALNQAVTAALADSEVTHIGPAGSWGVLSLPQSLLIRVSKPMRKVLQFSALLLSARTTEAG